MSDLRVELSQIDRSDIGSIKNILNSGFGQLLDAEEEFFGMNLSQWYDDILGKNNHMFAIRVSKDGGDIASRSWLVGVCGVTDVDWISRHGRITFVMVDKDGHKSTIQEHPASTYAFKSLLSYAFNELGLNKVWASALSNNNIAGTLDSYGFMAEGIRRKAAYVGGKYRDESVFSLTLKEYQERSK